MKILKAKRSLFWEHCKYLACILSSFIVQGVNWLVCSEMSSVVSEGIGEEGRKAVKLEPGSM